MAEERNYEQSSEPSLCANKCGFFANSMTLKLCSKCYREHVLREIRSKEMDALISATSSIKLTSTPSLTLSPSSAEARSVFVESVSKESQSRPSRCGAEKCRKKVGLIGFKCKCGETYCGTHRFPEDHSCTYDFKTIGKEAIAKANPLVKGHKLVAIRYNVGHKCYIVCLTLATQNIDVAILGAK